MTNDEKRKKLNTLEHINKVIGGCFRVADYIFAGHPSDIKAAKKIKKEATDSNVTLVEIQNIISGFLFRRTKNAKHSQEQIQKATDFFSDSLS